VSLPLMTTKLHRASPPATGSALPVDARVTSAAGLARPTGASHRHCHRRAGDPS
jgi:hypothetical protein